MLFLPVSVSELLKLITRTVLAETKSDRVLARPKLIPYELWAYKTVDRI